MKLTKHCINCGKLFNQPNFVSKKRWEKRQFCSLECRIKWRLNNEWKTSKCLFCGKEFRHYKYLNRRFCSIACKNRAPRDGIIISKCQFCGKDYSHKKSVKRLYCSKHCKDLSSSGENHWNWKGGITRENHRRETKQYKEWRLDVYRRNHFACQDCGKHCTRADMVAHHLRSWDAYLKLRYEVSNGITLCRVCHKIRHQKMKMLNQIDVD